ncbi:sensor histidine kinase [Ohessyouella blattaphilus]|uniref:Histidine kinase n=1 Tax=Ohessyouella blattaphilus TaxID=2949333 RepID=A0ABT1EEQ8_9FIRM|nr:histidine kinase [Ohessyouella blattaphilus]MCP1108979.1 histidine kinase [Ohessyouella blattaphilus]MCR8562373.1 histidine kinase [Ohessyouella blattaphilus]
MKRSFFKTIGGKLLIMFLAILLILGVGTLMVTIATGEQVQQKTEKQELQQHGKNLQEDMDLRLDSIRQLSDWAVASEDIATYLEDSEATDSAYHALALRFYGNSFHSYFRRIIIANSAGEEYLQAGAASFLGADVNAVKTITQLDYFQTEIERKEFGLASGLQADPFVKDDTDSLQLITLLHGGSEDTLGFFYLDIDPQIFVQVMTAYEDLGYDVRLELGGERYLVKDNTLTLSEKNTAIDPSESFPLSYEDCRVSLTKTKPTLAIRLASTYLPLLIGLLLLIGLFCLIFYMQTKKLIIKPARRIKNHLLKLATGQFTSDPTIETSDELGDIARSANFLSGSMKTYAAEVRQDEKARVERLSENADKLIDPGFASSALQTIKWMANIQQVAGIPEMAEALASFMKHVDQYAASTITVKEELTLLDDFFTIQKYRHPGNIELKYDIRDDRILNNSIPRFLLLSFTENALFQDFDSGIASGTIHIQMEYTQTHLKITVADSGTGPTSSATNELLGREDLHIKDLYGEAFGVDRNDMVDNHVFIITLPR